MRLKFSHRTYNSFEACQNGRRAENINKLLDEGRRVWGDDGPYEKGTEYEIDEAIQPHGNGIDVRTKQGEIVRVYSYYSPDERQQEKQ